MLDEGQYMFLLAADFFDHLLQRVIGVLPCQQRIQPLFQGLHAALKNQLAQPLTRRLQFLAVPDDPPQLQVECHDGAVLGKRVNESAYLAEYVRHAGLPVTDNLRVGVPAVHDQDAEEHLTQELLNDRPPASLVGPIIGTALVGEYP